jgi:hypothetical protein
MALFRAILKLDDAVALVEFEPALQEVRLIWHNGDLGLLNAKRRISSRNSIIPEHCISLLVLYHGDVADEGCPKALAYLDRTNSNIASGYRAGQNRHRRYTLYKYASEADHLRMRSKWVWKSVHKKWQACADSVPPTADNS